MKKQNILCFIYFYFWNHEMGNIPIIWKYVLKHKIGSSIRYIFKGVWRIVDDRINKEFWHEDFARSTEQKC